LKLKKVTKVRDVVEEFLSYRVGKGHAISLWFNDWHPAVDCLASG
jgi:hypothetical protein